VHLDGVLKLESGDPDAGQALPNSLEES
jgi:hypothetical protein